jgi:hypothetical protein
VWVRSAVHRLPSWVKVTGKIVLMVLVMVSVACVVVFSGSITAIVFGRPVGFWCAKEHQCAPGLYCRHPDRECRSVNATCQKVVDDCDGVFYPVCGCDDVTYINECLLRMNGVSLRHRGRCRNECTTHLDCAEESEAPSIDTGGGGGGGGVGFATSRTPTAGVGNDRESVRVMTAFSGRWVGGGVESNHGNHRPTMHCLRPPGRCNHIGRCSPVPTPCTHVWDPVCSCTNTTFANDCQLRRALQSIDYYGQCGS